MSTKPKETKTKAHEEAVALALVNSLYCTNDGIFKGYTLPCDARERAVAPVRCVIPCGTSGWVRHGDF